MKLNQGQTKILYFRPKRVQQTSIKFKCGDMDIKVATKYKYLGLCFNDYMDESELLSKMWLEEHPGCWELLLVNLKVPVVFFMKHLHRCRFL